MASLIRRRRGLIIKLVIGIPALWCFLLLLGVYKMNWASSSDDSGGTGEIVNNKRNLNEHNQQNEALLNPPPQKHEREVDAYFQQQQQQQHNLVFNPNDESNKVEEENIKKVPDHPEEEQMEQEHVDEPVDPNAPGEMGRPYPIDKDKLPPDERKIYDDGWQKNAFNQFGSDKISVHRSLPDVRDTECKSISYREKLPDTSVVICFHNEAWSVLVRTVHSVLDRSPKHLIKEIILVDDFSDMDHVKKPLEEYMAKLSRKVKIVRGKQREGLIRARLLGYSVATGDVVTFLDSHCECTEGWLEPLLDRIAENKSNVVCPVIDVIEDDSFKYQYGSAKSTSVGGFDWNLQFNWHGIPERERRRRNTDVDPLRSPTMAGGLFSISREYFTHIGTYDPGMDIWGGENLELSFRVWMCGGVLEIIPCSHVGHIFRKRSPYKWRTGVNVVKKNSVRLAEVWMDEYRSYYYERFNNDLGDFGDVSSRKKLRENLHCKSFDWYLKNIYPDLFIPGEALYSGEVNSHHSTRKYVHLGSWNYFDMKQEIQIRSKAKPMCVDSPVESQDYNQPVKMWPCHNQGGNQIRNKAKPVCIDSPVDKNHYHKAVYMWPCHNQGGNQYWMMSKQGEIRRDEGCLDYSGGESVIIYPCHGSRGNQEWQYREDKTLFHVNTGKCMEVSLDGKALLMRKCIGTDKQIWTFKKKVSKKE